jgi:hypothetical protein
MGAGEYLKMVYTTNKRFELGEVWGHLWAIQIINTVQNTLQINCELACIDRHDTDGLYLIYTPVKLRERELHILQSFVQGMIKAFNSVK